MKNETIKPCPFCGERGVEHRSGSDCSRDHDDIEKIWCPTCHCAWINNYWREGREFIDSTWNRRTPLPANVAEAVGRLTPRLRAHSEYGEPTYLGLCKPEVADLRTILEHVKEQNDEKR